MLSSVFRFFFSKAFWINTFLAGCLLFLGGKWTLGYLDDYTLHGENIQVPDFSGQKIEALDDFIKDQKIQYFIVDSVYKTDKKRGTVIDQDPPAGANVKEGRKIYLTVNAKLPMRVGLPDLRDVTLRQATAILEYYGLKAGSKKYIPDQCFNCVLHMEIKGSKVEPGTLVEKNTSVDLILGQGESTELAPIPSLEGKNLSEVQSILNTLALNFVPVEFKGCITPEDSASAIAVKQVPAFEKDVSINIGSDMRVWFICSK